MKISFNKKAISCSLLYIVLIASIVSMPPIITLLFSLIFIGIATFLNYSSILTDDRVGNAFFASLPIVLSSFQNVYL